MQYRVMLGIPCLGSIRQEVMQFVAHAYLTCHVRADLDELYLVPIQQVPTSVARNRLVQQAQKHKADLLFMIDDDMGVPSTFFDAALAFLMQHHGPALLGVPYVMGPPREDVNVFEWGSGQSNTKDRVWGLEKIVREDAVRRTGIEEVANIGTGCVAYKLECFAKVKPPYYDYQYADETLTEVIETEDTYCHRHMHFADVPLYVSWDHWSVHYKLKACSKPEIVTKQQLKGVFMEHARAELKQQLGKTANGKPSAAPLADSNQPFTLPAGTRIVSGSNGLAAYANGKKLDVDIEANQDAYILNCTRVLKRPDLQPQSGPFASDDAVAFAQSIEGWCSDAELYWLAETARRLNPGDLWVEVGSWKGRSFAAVALSVPVDCAVVAVDTWKGTHDEPSTQEAWDSDTVADEFDTVARLCFELRDRCISTSPERGTSLAVAERQAASSLAVAYIDASHRTEDVSANIKAWWPKVKPGGLLCGHDGNYSGVKAALEQCARELAGFEPTIEVGAIWCARVPVRIQVGGA